MRKPIYNTRSAKQVRSDDLPSKELLDYLLSSSEDEEIGDCKKVELQNEGSDPKCVCV